MPLAARPQSSQPSSAPSLAELARRLRAERKGKNSKAAKVFTNDNIPHHGGITVMGHLPEPSASASPREGRVASRRRKREKRSRAARDAFERENPCPATGEPRGACPGYVVDHIVPLACGGADEPSNMQWQTVADAKAKDKWERKGCGK